MTDHEAQQITGELRGLADRMAELERAATEQAHYAVQVAERQEIRLRQFEDAEGVDAFKLFAWTMLGLGALSLAFLLGLGAWRLFG